MEIMPNPKIMLLVFIVFMVTMFLLNKFVFQPLISFMDQREQKVANDLQLVNQDDNDLLQIEKEIQEILSKAKIEARTIKDEQIHEAKEKANNKIERIQAENKEKMESFMAKLYENKDQIKNEIKTSLGDIESLLLAKVKQI
ncbi:hypothetical protein CQA53_08485 [Helicobacter didelphidarum]|uniref:ATP synthase subunit b n=1 Tax=Helicobacter didelphidarum TaxID=2040648 RepID=A0A3D8IEA6_9HELI|nr:hypothetical protein [Helicobacter didelphidarum]RDU63448.1 hypothetical protein CQA53_08485 [Helicobacter didelphidarum]